MRIQRCYACEKAATSYLRTKEGTKVEDRYDLALCPWCRSELEIGNAILFPLMLRQKITRRPSPTYEWMPLPED